jgi:DNA replication and repair protein RecF
MRISRLELHNFRNYDELLLIPDAGLNLLIGKNAQGKTSLLEAMYILATSRSWRAGKDAEMIRWNAEEARVSAEIEREEQNDVRIDVAISWTEKKRILVNTIRRSRLADLMGEVNIVLIEPEDGDIVRGEPSRRRRFLNIEISQLQPQYCHLLVNYRKVLEQRNRLLRDLRGRRAGDGVLGVWNEQLTGYGSRMLERRLSFVRKIGDLARVIHSQITDGAESLEMKYISTVDLDGAETAVEIAERLRARLEELRVEEIHRGVTLVGPQRDDLTFTVNGVDARVYGSHGQQRTIALSLRLAEIELMHETAGEAPVVLLDDVMTDLDEERRGHVFAMTRGRCQTFITAASRRAFEPDFLESAKVFTVSEGSVTAA